MKKVLVIGGTRFFGRHLVNDLLSKNYEVYVVSRGNAKLEFVKEVTHIKADRKIKEELAKALEFAPYDVIIDQICMEPSEAQIVVQLFKDQCKRFINTSTGSVYDLNLNKIFHESDFDFNHFPYDYENTLPYDYQLAKRKIEAIYGHEMQGNVAMIRLPIVIGSDDYTNRFKWHIDQIKAGNEIYFPNIDANVTFVSSIDAGKFISMMCENDFSGAINCACSENIKLADFIKKIEVKISLKANLANLEKDNNHSMYGFPNDFIMNNEKAKSLGFKFTQLESLIDTLISEFTKVSI